MIASGDCDQEAEKKGKEVRKRPHRRGPKQTCHLFVPVLPSSTAIGLGAAREVSLGCEVVGSAGVSWKRRRKKEKKRRST